MARKKDYVERVLGEMARRDRALTFGTGLFLALALSVAALIAAALLDHGLILDSGVRVWARRGLLVLCGGGLAATLALSLRRMAAVRVARDVERVYPEFKDALVTYVQMRRGHGLMAEQRQVLKVVGTRAGVLLGRVDPEAVAPTRRFVAAGIALVGALGLFLVLCVTFWTPFVTSVRRVLAPHARVAPATATRIERIVVEPQHGPPATIHPDGATARALRESSCQVVATLAGELPARAILFWRPLGHDVPWRSQARGQTHDAGEWRWRLDTARDDLLVYIAAGDVRSDRFALRLVEPPLVTKLRVRLEPPAYTGLAPSEHDGGDVAALIGTRATVIATTSKPAAPQADLPCPDLLHNGPLRRRHYRPVLRLGHETLPLAVRGTTLTATFTVRYPTTYAIHFADELGFWTPRPPSHPVRPKDDQPPSVSIILPSDGTEVPLAPPLAVRVRATDDVAVQSVTLECKATGTARRRVRVPVGSPSPSVDHERALDLGALGFREGTTVELVARATDGRQPNPQTAASRSVRLTIVAGKPEPPDTAPRAAAPPRHEPAAEAAEPAPQQVQQLAERQQQLAERLRALRADAPDGERQEVAQQQQDIARVLERLGREMESSATPPGSDATPPSAPDARSTPPRGDGHSPRPDPQGQGTPSQQDGPARSAPEGSSARPSSTEGATPGNGRRTTDGGDGQAPTATGQGQGQAEGATGQARPQGGTGQSKAGSQATARSPTPGAGQAASAGKAAGRDATGKGTGTPQGRPSGTGRGDGTQPGAGIAKGPAQGPGGVGAGEARALAQRLHDLAATVRSSPGNARTRAAAEQAARDLLALGRRLERGEFEGRRVSSERALPSAQGRGKTVLVGDGRSASSAGGVLPADVPPPSPDEMRKLLESGRVRLSPTYRRLVEQYVEALSHE